MRASDESTSGEAKRVLATSALGAERPRPHFVVAATLAEARRTLEAEGHRDIRFWSHPYFGDVYGSTPEDAYKRAAKPSSWLTSGVLAVLAVTTPATVFLWAAALLDGVGVVIPRALAVYAAFPMMAGLFVMVLAFPLMGLELRYRRYGRAYALLWALRLGMPLLWPLLELWAVKIRAGRLGRERALARYRWLRHVGLARIHRSLERQALDQMGDLRAQIELLRLTAAPGSQAEAQLALTLALASVSRPPDAEVLVGEARRLVDREGGTSLVRSVRELVSALADIEEGRDARDALARAREQFLVAARGQGGTWVSLFQIARVRALVRAGEAREADALFRRAAGPLLWAGEEALVDAAALDLATWARDRGGNPAFG